MKVGALVLDFGMCTLTDRMLTSVVFSLALAAVVTARPQAYDSQPFVKALRARQAPTNATGLEVDLGYAIYRGSANSSTNLNVFKG